MTRASVAGSPRPSLLTFARGFRIARLGVAPRLEPVDGADAALREALRVQLSALRVGVGLVVREEAVTREADVAHLRRHVGDARARDGVSHVHHRRTPVLCDKQEGFTAL